MLIKNIAEIETKIIYEQADYNTKNFAYFLFNYKRSKAYSKGISLFLILLIGGGASQLTMSVKELPSLFLFEGFVITVFIIAQYQEWIKCYLIEHEFFFGYRIGNRCFFPIKRKAIDIKKIYVDEDFSSYILSFSYGFLKYSFSFTEKNKRIDTLKKISEFANNPNLKIENLLINMERINKS